MEEDKEKGVRYMLFDPRCGCERPIVELEKIELTENGTLKLFGYCKKRCERMIATGNVFEFIKEMKEHFDDGAENVM